MVFPRVNVARVLRCVIICFVVIGYYACCDDIVSTVVAVLSCCLPALEPLVSLRREAASRRQCCSMLSC